MVKVKSPILNSSLSSDEISRQLERMLARSCFNATPQQIAFFKFVGDQTLAGNADQINGYTVATVVFGHRLDFAQSIDPVVSIQTDIMRWKLERCYLTAGKYDSIRIDIPRDNYVPVFNKRELNGP